MIQKDKSGRKSEKQGKSGDRQREEQLEVMGDPTIEQPAEKGSSYREKRKARRKELKEELKSRTTGVGLKISVERDTAPINKKIIFDDSNIPTDEGSDGNTDDDSKDRKKNNEISVGKEEDSDDNDEVEEVQGKAARDEVLDQIETEAKQSLKTNKKRKRKPRKEKTKEDPKINHENESNDDDEYEEMDADFFAQLDSVREKELEEREELEKSATMAASRGRHTTFVFAENESDDKGMSDPVQINDSIQVVVLKKPSSASEASGNRSFVSKSSISKKALLYSRNQLRDGSDHAAGIEEAKRKQKRSGEDIQPWKRGKQRLSMGRSRMTKGKPAAFFKRKRR